MGGTKTSLSYLWQRLREQGVDVELLWENICDLAVRSLVCVDDVIPYQPNSFEVWSNSMRNYCGLLLFGSVSMACCFARSREASLFGMNVRTLHGCFCGGVNFLASFGSGCACRR